MYINGIILRTLIAELDAHSLDTNQLLASVGLNQQTILSDAFKLEANVFGQLLENMVQLSGDERLGLKLGFKTPLSLLGNLGGLYQSCPTLAHMLQAMHQYVGWLDGINTYHWEESGRFVYITTACDPVWQATYPLAARQMIEHNIGFSLRWKREYLGKPITPLAIAVPYSRIGSVDLLETYFDCSVQFNYPYLQITLPSTYLAYPAVTANERARKAYEMEMANFKNEHLSYEWRVRRVLEAQLSLFKPSLQGVAQQLAQSPRSLQRRLQQEGFSFQAILDDVRLELARYYEQTCNDLPKKELADRLGFIDTASLSRFLKKRKS
jgi:AraC-like DNA-binding protein